MAPAWARQNGWNLCRGCTWVDAPRGEPASLLPARAGGHHLGLQLPQTALAQELNGALAAMVLERTDGAPLLPVVDLAASTLHKRRDGTCREESPSNCSRHLDASTPRPMRSVSRRISCSSRK